LTNGASQELEQQQTAALGQQGGEDTIAPSDDAVDAPVM